MSALWAWQTGKDKCVCCYQPNHHLNVIFNSELPFTWAFFSLRSKTVCSSFFCFLVRGFLVDAWVNEDVFFLDLLAGKTKALLSSTPFRLLPSEEVTFKKKSYKPSKRHKWQKNKLRIDITYESLPCSSTTTSVLLSAVFWESFCCLPFQLCFLLSFPIFKSKIWNN